MEEVAKAGKAVGAVGHIASGYWETNGVFWHGVV